MRSRYFTVCLVINCSLFFFSTISFSEVSYSSINGTDFNFAVVGDWGCTPNTIKTVKSIQKHNPELIISLGDTSYQFDGKCWLDIVKPISDRMKITIGNHDATTPNILHQLMNNFQLSKQYYSFDYEKIHFLVMSSEFLYLPGSDQYNFVQKDLSKASKNSDTKWIIVVIHRQQYSSLCGDHDSCDSIKKLRNTYHPIFEKYGVDLLLSGHAHNYQRTYPLLYNSVNSSQPMIKDTDNYNEYSSPKGMFQIVVGTGGIDFDRFSNNEPYVVYQQHSSYGFLNIDVKDEGNTFVGRYYANNGTILDQFKISK